MKRFTANAEPSIAPFPTLPEGIFESPANHGTVERVDYTVITEKGSTEGKHCWVYVPYGYDPLKQYDILYFLHSGLDNADAMFFTKNEEIPDFAALLDNMIGQKLIRPMLVVTPSYYPVGYEPGGMDADMQYGAAFPHEMFHDLIPAVESKYAGYCRDFSREGLIASAAHRALGGFSMGAVTLWHCFLKELRCFDTYMALSGDCWAVCLAGGSVEPDKTADLVEAALAAVPEDQRRFYIYAATGTDDIAHDNMTGQMDAMRRHNAGFIFAPKGEGGNIFYVEQPGGTHTYPFIYQYLYSFLPDAFPAD